jgi:RNA polymerase sigma-70 factor (ECF subfamily)
MAYRAHGTELYGMALRTLGDRGLAEEAVQETFLRAWSAAERFDPELGSLRTWLFAIARNVVIDISRSRAVRPRLSEHAEVEDRADESEDPYAHALLAWEVEEALRRLGEAHRTVLLETYFRARPYAEVAAELGIPEGTVKSRLSRARGRLAELLNEQESPHA